MKLLPPTPPQVQRRDARAELADVARRGVEPGAGRQDVTRTGDAVEPTMRPTPAQARREDIERQRHASHANAQRAHRERVAMDEAERLGIAATVEQLEAAAGLNKYERRAFWLRIAEGA